MGRHFYTNQEVLEEARVLITSRELLPTLWLRS